MGDTAALFSHGVLCQIQERWTVSEVRYSQQVFHHSSRLVRNIECYVTHNGQCCGCVDPTAICGYRSARYIHRLAIASWLMTLSLESLRTTRDDAWTHTNWKTGSWQTEKRSGFNSVLVSDIQFDAYFSDRWFNLRWSLQASLILLAFWTCRDCVVTDTEVTYETCSLVDMFCIWGRPREHRRICAAAMLHLHLVFVGRMFPSLKGFISLSTLVP